MPSRCPSQSSSTASAAHRVSRQATRASNVPLPSALYTSYTTKTTYHLDSSTSLVVNTWHNLVTDNGIRGATMDEGLANKAWEHARRRMENGCIILGSFHASTPSLLAPFLSTVPFAIPDAFYTALSVLRPFFSCTTPQNALQYRYSALCASFTLSVKTGEAIGINLNLSKEGLDISRGLLNVPSETGYRAFDVFYYILSSTATAAEREALGLRAVSSYTLLQRSGTYALPDHLPAADDAMAAEEFRENLKAIGMSGKERRDLISTLAALLRVGDASAYLLSEDDLEDIYEEVAALFKLNPQVLKEMDKELLISNIYQSLVDWVLRKANAAIAKDLLSIKLRSSPDKDGWSSGVRTSRSLDLKGDTVMLTIVDISDPQLGRAIALRSVFDESAINAEMREDGVPFPTPSAATLAEMKSAVASAGLEVEPDTGLDQHVAILEYLCRESDEGSFIGDLLRPHDRRGETISDNIYFDLRSLIINSRVWFHLSIHPTDALPTDIPLGQQTWSASSISNQVRSWRLSEWASRSKQVNYTADFELDEFQSRYAKLGCADGRDGIESFVAGRGWSNGQVYIGRNRVWMRESAWWEVESMLDLLVRQNTVIGTISEAPILRTYQDDDSLIDSSFADPMAGAGFAHSMSMGNQNLKALGRQSVLAAKSIGPTIAHSYRTAHTGDYGLGTKGDELKGFLDDLDPEAGNPKLMTVQPMSATRKIWTTIVWLFTFCIPSPLLRYIGGMRRPDVRMAWREKIIIVLIIFLLNAAVVFYIVEFGRLLCPNFDKAWNIKEIGEHTGTNDMYVSVRGRVYDITKFARIQHSSVTGVQVTESAMDSLAGLDLDEMFPIPLYIGCSGLVSNTGITLLSNASDSDLISSTTFTHTFGALTPYSNSGLADKTWYWDIFLPKMKEYYKGELVTSIKTVASEGASDDDLMIVINNNVYDLSDYAYTLTYESGNDLYSFLSDDVYNLIQQNMGQDITSLWNEYALKNSTDAALTLNCLNNVFYVGKTDFRQSPRCMVNNYILLAFTIILCAVILVKFLAALQFGGKRHPAPQDRFVIMQIPCYTESEDHLRKSIDSLTNMNYDNKRKLICVICDGLVVGSGNTRPTPKIVLDLLGVDPKIDPPALPFKSVGQGSEQLNYGKVYSGLYESDGNVVPYLVVVKVGKDSEQTGAKPGNRGKRDSQILLLNFLNRVHHQKAMSPLELEMYHQIRNVIGVAPELYEYLFMVDADTSCDPDSLNHLVASCTNDSKIAGICGETSLENEGRSLITMMQVYEYYISHHLAKAFESLFGSVTCLPGCFSMYRMRNDRGKPLIISDDIVQAYGDGDIDTLHKKNLLHLGEDRYLTTLMTKHFPHMSYKFNRDAHAHTAAPESFSVLLSQRRRWQNSTVHNLMELFLLKDMCGFCCFSMRFVVLIDLFGTVILPATCVYLGYLIYTAASGGAIPLISLIMLACVYGLQAVIFILRRKWEMIGWLVFYILAFPIYSFVLPIYSFWQMDNFSWGNTRVVIGEKGGKQVVVVADEPFDPRSIPLQFWDDYASANGLPGRYSDYVENLYEAPQYDENGYEMDELRSVYSTEQPASTFHTGLHGSGLYLPPPSRGQTPAPVPPTPRNSRPPVQQRQSTYSHFSHYTDTAPPSDQPLTYHANTSFRALLPHSRQNSYHHHHARQASTDNLLGTPSPPPPHRPSSKSPLGFSPSRPPLSRPGSTLSLGPNLLTGHGVDQASDERISEAIRACLAVVDLDSVTKKQLKVAVERRLGVQLSRERREWLDREIDVELERM